MPTRDELLADIKEQVEKCIPENAELDGDDLESLETAIENVFATTTEAMDEAEDEDEDPDASLNDPSEVMKRSGLIK